MKIRVGILTAPKIEFERREKTFLLKNVRIGIGFHWDRYEDQEFEGELEILHNADGTETAVNIIDLEDYLASVISSEMAATSNPELLKAHAVISRSWALRAIGHTEHIGYDVCADDHCQRYEGLQRMNQQAREAIDATRGEVLAYNGEVCDCRYYKCCGGRSEIFETCWNGPTPDPAQQKKGVITTAYPYLESVECPYCAKAMGNGAWAKDFRSRYLNNYDQETLDFHDWTVRYTPEELSDIIREKRGIDFGEILSLTPIKRGASGRIYELEIVGTQHRETIGKELVIRYALSRKCLYSSWFQVSRQGGDWILTGHGWGHGVGLCQIGAAVMAEQQHDYRTILAHYYKNTQIIQSTETNCPII